MKHSFTAWAYCSYKTDPACRHGVAILHNGRSSFDTKKEAQETFAMEPSEGKERAKRLGYKLRKITISWEE